MKTILERDDFVRVWNFADSLEHFCEITHYDPRVASSRASRLRRQDYKLKIFTVDQETRSRIGRLGGQKGTTGGFYANRELASIAGAKGGRASRRKK